MRVEEGPPRGLRWGKMNMSLRCHVFMFVMFLRLVIGSGVCPR